MFKDIEIKPTYSSYEDDIANEFYNPILKESICFDRVSAYFSAKALAIYSQGLECFANNNGKYRLIISEQISENDYNEIKKGYDLRKSIYNEMIERLNENISLKEEKEISNLAYLISLGVVDIKIAFTQRGIFHDKVGIFKDDSNNIICFRGSNNETYEAIVNNYESFEVTCSWLSSEFDYQKIENSINKFEMLWNNEVDKVIVMDCQSVIKKQIMRFNKNKIIIDETFLKQNAVVFDFDNNKLLLHNNLKKNDLILKGSFYKFRLKKYVDYENNKNIFFRDNINYVDLKKIIGLVKNFGKEKNFDVLITQRLNKYLNKKEMYLEKRYKIGIEIKNRDSKYIKKLNSYKNLLEKRMNRMLREKQLWDSFYMCVMKKCSNFSVPGSGKTASVLGVYAYLKYKNIIENIVMIGPKNSFGSWIDEFNICFKGKEELRCFNIHDKLYRSREERRRALKYDTGNVNLFLFNYESISTYEDLLKNIINDKTLLVYDEVHRIKKINGQYAKSAINVSKNANYIITMTGTPIPNSYQDIYNNLKILYYDEYEDFFNFNVNRLKNPSYNEIKNINQRIQPFFCRTTKKQLGVPDANEDKIYEINSSNIENKLFNILYSKYKKNMFLMLIRILQLESNPKMLLEKIDINDFERIFDVNYIEETVDVIDYSSDVVELLNSIDVTTKTSRCIELVKKLVKEDKTVIIWCIFINSMSNLANILESINIKTRCINGSIELEERQYILNEFKNKKIKVLITNPHTLGESISLHTICHDSIYFEYSYNLVHLLQSKDRIHRLGLKENDYTQYYYLQSIFNYKGQEISIDKKIYNRLDEKEKNMLNAIENDILEVPSTTEEDLEIIFNELF